jgi:hypothetical protein
MSIFARFYDNEILKKYTTAFGTIFKDMEIMRKNTDNTEFERYVVPLSYAPKEKFIQRINSDPELLRQEGIMLPRMAFEMANLSYDPSRNLSNKRDISLSILNDGNKKTQLFYPAPYNMVFELYIATKTINDMLQIVEQILPAFRPDYNISVKLFSFNDQVTIDVPISLMSNIDRQDSYDGEIGDRRSIIWTLQFLVKGYVFGPINTSGKGIIKQVDMSIHDMSQVGVADPNKIELGGFTLTVVVEGKTLEEILESDDWDIETIFR